jgi:hypothetical protein
MSKSQYRTQYKSFYRREWLNEPTRGTAFIEAEVEETDSWSHGYGTVTIKDCTRQIELSFPLDGPERRQNSLAKIKLLMEVLGGFYKELSHEAKRAEARDAESAARRALWAENDAGLNAAEPELVRRFGPSLIASYEEIESQGVSLTDDECHCDACLAGTGDACANAFC